MADNGWDIEFDLIEPSEMAVRLIRSAANRAIKKGLAFDLDVKVITEILERGVCQQGSGRFNFTSDYHNIMRPSIDRIDSYNGYTMDNIQIVTQGYNRGKGKSGDKEMIQLCQDVTFSQVTVEDYLEQLREKNRNDEWNYTRP